MKALYLILSVLGLIACQPQSGSASNSEDTIIVDVRTPEEWVQDGHADCTVNYPMDQFAEKIPQLKSYKKVILVCRSGNRAGKAKQMLEQAGYMNVENSGAWQNIDCKHFPTKGKP